MALSNLNCADFGLWLKERKQPHGNQNENESGADSVTIPVHKRVLCRGSSRFHYRILMQDISACHLR